jgi:hypothetical protein
MTLEKLKELRRQLQSDRALCSNSTIAQSYLDGAEQILIDLENKWAKANPVDVALELCRAEIGNDVPTPENIAAVFQEIQKAEAGLAAVGAELRDTPEYLKAEELVERLREHFEALTQKKIVQDRVHGLICATAALREELTYCDKLVSDNPRVSADIALFEKVKEIAPSLDRALDSPIQLRTKPEVSPEPDPEMERVFRVIGDGWRGLIRKPGNL